MQTYDYVEIGHDGATFNLKLILTTLRMFFSPSAYLQVLKYVYLTNHIHSFHAFIHCYVWILDVGGKKSETN